MSSPLPDSTRSRSDSADDLELPTHDRKRPRLSAGGNDVHTTPPLPSPSFQEPASLSTSSLGQNPTQQQSTMKPELPPRPSAGSASQVTINTRPLSLQAKASDESAEVSDVAIDPALIQLASTCTEQDDHVSQQEHIEAERSPSPVIEIAEPEDLDGDPADTRWTTRIGDLHYFTPAVDAYHIHQTFPLAHNYPHGEAFRAVTTILRGLAHNNERQARDLFCKVKDWLMEFVVQCETLTREVIDSEVQFWQQFPQIFSALWQCHPKMYSNLQYTDITDFCIAYGRLLKLVVESDLRHLRVSGQDPGFDIRLLTGMYLMPVSMTVNRCAFPNTPHQSSAILNPRRASDAEIDVLLQEPAKVLLGRAGVDLLTTIAKYTEALGPALQKSPTLSIELIKIVDATVVAAQSLSPVILSERFCVLSEDEEEKQALMLTIEKIVHTVNGILQTAIKKQHSWLNLETAQQLVSRFGLVVRNIPVELPRLGQQIIQTACLSVEDADLTYLAETMPYAWRLWISWMFVKFGRMELRVYGIDTISQDLLGIWEVNIRHDQDGKYLPLVKYIVRFLRANDIVKYVIGVDSHQQLTSRAHSLVGFFGVAGAYENADTDIMWKTIMETPDPRIASDVSNMLEQSLAAINLDNLYHICEKLSKMPFEQWNDIFIRIVLNILTRLTCRNFAPIVMAPNHPQVPPVVRTLCLTVLRYCMRPGICGTDIASKLAGEISLRLPNYFQLSRTNLGHFDFSDDEEVQIFSDLGNDMSKNTNFAGGATLVMQSIFQQVGMGRVASELIEMCNLPHGLITNIAHLTQAYQGIPESESPELHLQMKHRIKLLGQVFNAAPEKFAPDSFELLWKSLFSNSALDLQTRRLGWKCLTDTMKNCQRGPNIVIQTVLADYWPRLQSEVIDAAILQFACSAVTYENRFSSPSVMSADGTVKIPGVDRVRGLMLKAPTGTVENEAADFIIDQYLTHPALKRQGPSVVHATQLALIDESVGIVLGSASRLQSMMSNADGDDHFMDDAIIASPDEIATEELKFDRSLLFLRRFTEAIKSKPGMSPLAETLPAFAEHKGISRELVLEVASSKHVGKGPRKISVGIDNTGKELWQYIADVTGFSSFKLFVGGHEIDLQDNERTISDLNIMAKVQVQKTRETTECEPARHMRSVSPVDEKIMRHIDDLCALLEADDRLAKEVFDFLSITLVRKEIAQKLRDMKGPASEALFSPKAYKLLFYTQAMRSVVEEEALSRTPDVSFLSYARQALIVSISRLTFNGVANPLAFKVLEELVGTLLMALRAKTPVQPTKSTYFEDCSMFTTCLQQFLTQAARNLAVEKSEQSVKSFCEGIECLIEGALHDERLWAMLKSSPGFADCLVGVFFNIDGRMRRSVSHYITTLTGHSASKSVPKTDSRCARLRHSADDIERTLLELWKSCQPLISVSSQHSDFCQEFFDSCLGMFQRLEKLVDGEMVLATFSACQQAFLEHEFTETIGKIPSDRLIAGTSPLLKACALILRNRGLLPSQSGFIRHIFTGWLFPRLDDPNISPKPVIDSNVRAGLYDLCLALVQGVYDFGEIMCRLTPPSAAEQYLRDVPLDERLNLRSEVGYAGLINLSNTCYLNSLFSQLFMNVGLRKFFFERTQDDVKYKGLISQLAKVFGYMQSSYFKAVCPKEAVDTIMTYDNAPIDVTIQMDVDEFFNLLFDRIETNIVNEEHKMAFRSFYGGQVIQQIKSTECEHVSERPEPFSVVPVEIKGKSSLNESLRAYVEGEVLQGDNKYSCTSCNKHVDAVKRSCFKQIPDNLIFNLKRFDYDILTGMRAKLNDRFEFPNSIDMAPYTLENIMSGKTEHTSDIFELTGIIVHTGTAETGHYYSFVRERPSPAPTTESWVQFNDCEVTRFDPSSIPDNCFGGTDSSSYLHMAKFYNAYMLFYQRRQDIEHGPRLEVTTTPFHVTGMPSSVSEEIERVNGVTLQAYVLQDPKHAKFVVDLLRLTQDLSGEQCTSDHVAEVVAIETALDYMKTFSTKWKAMPEVGLTVGLLRQRVERCETCASLVAEWLTNKHHDFYESFLKDAYPPARRDVTHLLLQSLVTLRDFDERGIQKQKKFPPLLNKTLDVLDSAWLDATSRFAWTEYFFLVSNISQLNLVSLNFTLNVGFIKRILELIEVHSLDSKSERLVKKYERYLDLRYKRKVFDHGAMVECLYTLLDQVDFDHSPEGGARAVITATERVGLSESEMQVLDIRDDGLGWLRKLIRSQHTSTPALQLVALLARNSSTCKVFGKTLSKAQLGDTESMEGAKYIEAILTFASQGCEQSAVVSIVRHAMDYIVEIEPDYGYEFLGLMQQLANASNAALGYPSGFLDSLLREGVVSWAPPLLYGQNEQGVHVREQAYELFGQYCGLTTEDGEMVPDSAAVRERAKGIMRGIVDVGSHYFLKTRDPRIDGNHFKFALAVFNECQPLAFPEYDGLGTECPEELSKWRNTMNRLAVKAADVVDLVSQDYDMSSELEELSDDATYDTER